MNKKPLKNSITLAVEFDQTIFDTIVNHPDLGLEAWNSWMRRLLDSNTTASCWCKSAGEEPPAVTVFFHFTKDMRKKWITADWRPVWFDGDPDEPEHAPEIFVIPIKAVPVKPSNTEFLLHKS